MFCPQFGQGQCSDHSLDRGPCSVHSLDRGQSSDHSRHDLTALVNWA